MTGSPRRDERGFSLIELMAVVAILGILVTIAIASFVVSAERSRSIACIHNQRLMDSGLMQYQIMNKGLWPDTLADVEPYVDWSGDDFATCVSDPDLPFGYDNVTGSVWCDTHPR